MTRLGARMMTNNTEKTQAGIELASFVGNALIGIADGIEYSLKYGYKRPQRSTEEVKEIFDAVNNAAKLFSNNEKEKEICNTLTQLAKAYLDYHETKRGVNG